MATPCAVLPQPTPADALAAQQETAVQTTLLAQMGESYATNRAWKATLMETDRRLGILDTRAVRDGHAVAGTTLDVAYERHRTRWITRTAMITLFATVCVLAPVALLRMDRVTATTAYVMAGVVLVIFAAVLIVIVRNVAYRRRDDWDRYYFRTAAVSQQALEFTSTGGGGRC